MTAPHSRRLLASAATIAIALGLSTAGAAAAHAEIAPVVALSSPTDTSNWTEYDGLLYFTGFNGSEYRVYSWDGVNAAVEVPGAYSDPSDIAAAEGYLYFAASDGTDQRTWIYGGSGDAEPVAADLSINPSGLVEFDNDLWYGALQGGNYKLVHHDESTLTTFYGTLPPYFPGSLTPCGVLLCMTGSVDTMSQGTMWTVADDGMAPVPVAGSFGSPQLYTDFNGLTYLTGDDGADFTLHSFNGTTLSTVAGAPTGIYAIMAFNGFLYLGASNGGDGALWAYDGVNPPVEIEGSPAFALPHVGLDGTLYLTSFEDGDRFAYSWDGTTFTRIAQPPVDPDTIFTWDGKVYLTSGEEDDGNLYVLADVPALAATGTDATVWLGLGGALVAAGIVAFGLARHRATREGARL